VMLVLLVGTGILLTIRCNFLTWRNLPWAIIKTLSKESRTKNRGEGDVSPFSALTTALAATIGTGNIVGVATAMVSGGAGALVWMWISACFGLSSKFSECMLAIKYREVNEKGEMSGGPMYTMKKALKNKKLGAVLGWLFALFAVIASFGIGNMTQGNSISTAVHETFGVSVSTVGAVITILALLIIIGGIKTISKVSSVVVPVMAIFYVIAGVIVILGNISNLPAGLSMIFHMAFSVKAVGGALCGNIVASMMNAARYGVARGCFSNEAGMGSAATTDHPVRQAYINMTGTFWDTIVVCTITGLAIASSGVLGQIDPATGEMYIGSALTIAAFSTVLGKVGGYLVTIGIALFAFSTILGWEYHGEKAFEYLMGTHKFNMIYRIIFSLVAYVGATQTLELVWNFSDIANALMAIPNLICMLLLSGEIAKDVKEFQKTIEEEKARK
jgi:AGCS family alanine or glycine:cation symporter